MVKRQYVGIGDGVPEFRELRAAHIKLSEMRLKCTPLGPDYEALSKVLHALKDAATHFTRDPYFYGGGPH
ncbi:MAG: hypothetical protein Q7T23_18425 [Phenylobacterium sp.]|nr:hypothetical protein [Phenylobacterium sp.]